jgi:hypothetical protein
METSDWRYRATTPTTAACRLRERRDARPLRFPVIRQLRARGAGQVARDALPGHLLARHIDDFLADLANANRPRNTIRAYRGDLIAFAAHHDGDITGLAAAPVRAFLAEIAARRRAPPREPSLSAAPLPTGGHAELPGGGQPGHGSDCIQATVAPDPPWPAPLTAAWSR